MIQMEHERRVFLKYQTRYRSQKGSLVKPPGSLMQFCGSLLETPTPSMEATESSQPCFLENQPLFPGTDSPQIASGFRDHFRDVLKQSEWANPELQAVESTSVM